MSFKEFGQWFWNDNFWLPPNVTWDQFKTEENKRYVEILNIVF